MVPLVGLSVAAVSGLLLLVAALTLVAVFPKVSAVRPWALSWLLPAGSCLALAVSPFLEWYVQTSAETTFRALLILAGNLALGLGYLTWFQVPLPGGRGLWIRAVLWGGTLAAAALQALAPPASAPLTALTSALWAGVPVAVAAALTVVRGLRAPPGALRSQSAALLGALVLGPVPFVLSWAVLPAFPGLGWPLGMPLFLVLGAALTLRALVHFDTRFHPQQATGFLLEKTQDTVLFLRADGAVQSTNPSFKGLLDREEDQFVGQKLSLLGADETSRQALGPLESLVYPDWEGTVSLSHRSGRSVPVHLVFRRIHNPAREAVGAVILVYDLRFPRRLDLSSREDSLTALSNRRWVLELLEAEFHRARRFGGPLAALWLVVDHLDEVEQRLGSETSDDVLRRLGAILRGGLRKTDLCGRVGNREFLVVLPETREERARLVSTRLEKMFALSSEAETSGVSLRMGLATLDAGCPTPEDFVRQVKASVPPTTSSP